MKDLLERRESHPRPAGDTSILSTLSTYRDFLSCTRCGGIRTVSLDGFRQQVRGTPYRRLIEFHVRSHDRAQLAAGLDGVRAMLPPGAHPVGEELVERWDGALRGEKLWDADAAEVLDRIVAEGREALRARDIPPAGDILFDLFELVTLRFALVAVENRELRRRMGIRSRSFASRHGWRLVVGAAAAYLLTVVESAGGQVVLAAVLGLVVLPPIARAVSTGLAGKRESRG